MSRMRQNASEGAGAIALAILIIVAMPICGLYLIRKKDMNEKVSGWILLVVGLALWIAIAIIGAK